MDEDTAEPQGAGEDQEEQQQSSIDGGEPDIEEEETKDSEEVNVD